MSGRGLRIIAGALKGRRLRVPPSAAVRPTPERVREALFSILGARTESAAVLDAFAGSGALGFEAASRGAARVVFVESDSKVAEGLRASVAELGIEKVCRVVEGRLPGSIARSDLAGPFDIVLADPPYAVTAEESQRALEALASVLAPEGILAWERPSRAESPPGTRLERTASRRYGNTTLDLYRWGPRGGPGEPG